MSNRDRFIRRRLAMFATAWIRADARGNESDARMYARAGFSEAQNVSFSDKGARRVWTKAIKIARDTLIS